MNIAIIVPIIVALVAPLGAYLLAVRKMSGRVDTSEASQLWAESRSIRDDYRSRLAENLDRTRDLEARVAKLEGINNELVRENAVLRAKITELENTIVKLDTTIVKLQEVISDLRGET